MFHVPEHYRLKFEDDQLLGSDASYGNNGFFIFYRLVNKKEIEVRCIASDFDEWEHVSVTLGIKETPSWELMCEVKIIFWDDEDTVIQYHPPKSLYVNCHKYCLHLWRPADGNINLPPSYLVGPKGLNLSWR